MPATAAKPFRYRDATLRHALKVGTLYRIDLATNEGVQYAWCPDAASARYMTDRIRSAYPRATVTAARVETLDV